MTVHLRRNEGASWCGKRNVELHGRWECSDCPDCERATDEYMERRSRLRLVGDIEGKSA